MSKYYHRPEWELYDLKYDPEELSNLVHKKDFQEIFKTLKMELHIWLNKTNDPWICSPHGVLENKGSNKDLPQCFPLLNDKF